MDFEDLMSVAASHIKDSAAIKKKGYSAELPPPKREKKKPKTGPRSAAIQAFLDKKEADKKAAEEAEARNRLEFLAQQKSKKFKIPKGGQTGSPIKATEAKSKDATEPKPPKSRDPEPAKLSRARDAPEPSKYVSDEAKQKHADFMKKVVGGKKKDKDDEIKYKPMHHEERPVKQKRPTPPSGPMDFASLMKSAQKQAKDPDRLKKAEEDRDRALGIIRPDSIEDLNDSKKPKVASGKDMLEKELGASTPALQRPGPKCSKPGPKCSKEKQLTSSSNSKSSSSSSQSKTDSHHRSQDASKTFNGSSASKTKVASKWPADAPRHIPSSSSSSTSSTKGCDSKSSKTSTPSKSAPTSKSPTPTKQEGSKSALPKSTNPKTSTMISNGKSGKTSALPPKPSKPPPSKLPSKAATPPQRRNIEDGAARWESLMKSQKTNNSSKSSKKRVIDSDSEYDSEMDDFIDDGDYGADEVSSAIKAIFGYDKSKFQHIDEDSDDDMETNFASIQKEERISAKLGLKEDLEDIRKEQEEIKRKEAKKKAAKKNCEEN